MKRKLMYAAGGLMLLASPIFAQTPAAGGGGTDLKLPFAYLAVGIASGLCGLGQGKVAASAAEAMARNPGAQAGIRLLPPAGAIFDFNVNTGTFTYNKNALANTALGRALGIQANPAPPPGP